MSLLLRLPYVRTERLWPDEALYARIARDFLVDPRTLASPSAYSDHLPVVPAVLSIGSLFAEGLAGLRTMTLLLNLVGIILTYVVGRRVAGRFAGLCAALFLAVNPWYFSHSQLILIDGPFAVAQLGLALTLLAVRPSSERDRVDLRVAIVATLVAALKWYAALMIAPVVLLYYLAACRELSWGPRLRKLALPALGLAGFGVPYLAWKLGNLGGHGGIAAYFDRPATYYLQVLPDLVGGPVNLGLVLAGAAFLFRRPPHVRVLVGATVLVELAVLSLAPERDERYVQPILPFLGILFGLGVGELVELVVRRASWRAGARALALGLLCLLFVPLVQQKDRMSLTEGYTGFLEAGQALSLLATPDALILAGSVRAIKYAVGHEQEPLVVGLPPTLEELRARVRGHAGPVVLETDRWEYTQPAWIFPWSPAKLETLLVSGFRVAAAVRRPVSGEVLPVVVVLLRERVTPAPAETTATSSR